METCYFFGNDRTKPLYRPTDLIGYLPEEKRHHYRSGYSMAAGTECWIDARGCLPQRIAELVGDDRLDAAHFEYGVTVWGHGRSMTDVMAFIPDATIATEAKARETFGEKVRCWIDQDKKGNPDSPKYRRKVVGRYARALGVRRDALLDLRYQLLHRSLSAALVATRSGQRRAWMIVQSFSPIGCVEHARNRADFDRYVAVASALSRQCARFCTAAIGSGSAVCGDV